MLVQTCMICLFCEAVAEVARNSKPSFIGSNVNWNCFMMVSGPNTAI